MRVHVLQHVPFEGPASIAEWAERRGHSLAMSHLYAGDPPPVLEDFDLLVVMGGPMGVYDELEHSWLRAEKACIGNAIAGGRALVGICLGAQLIAQALGAAVSRNPVPEIGWFPVSLTPAGAAEPLCAELPDQFVAFHWHGDRFEIPPGAVHLLQSDACEQQGFVFADRVLGLQCHLESLPASVAALCEHCADEIHPGPTIQTAATMMAAGEAHFSQLHAVLDQMLDRLVAHWDDS